MPFVTASTAARCVVVEVGELAAKRSSSAWRISSARSCSCATSGAAWRAVASTTKRSTSSRDDLADRCPPRRRAARCPVPAQSRRSSRSSKVTPARWVTAPVDVAGHGDVDDQQRALGAGRHRRGDDRLVDDDACPAPVQVSTTSASAMRRRQVGERDDAATDAGGQFVGRADAVRLVTAMSVDAGRGAARSRSPRPSRRRRPRARADRRARRAARSPSRPRRG